MTTVTAPPTQKDAPAVDRRALKVAARMLERAGLRPARGVDREQMVKLLAKLLATCSPRDPHGALLAAALQPRAGAKGGPRPPAEQVVRRLLRHGHTPTGAAVAGELEGAERAEAARVERAARLAATAQANAGRAVRLVAERWALQGSGPTWHELGRAMGWSPGDVAAVIRALVADGHLEAGIQPRSLRPPGHDQQGAP